MRHYCRLHKRNYEADKDEGCPWCRIEALERRIAELEAENEILRGELDPLGEKLANKRLEAAGLTHQVPDDR
jgi:hypothetical protein